MRFLDGTERPFDFALGAGSRAASVRPCRHVREDVDLYTFHDPLEYGRFSDGPLSIYMFSGMPLNELSSFGAISRNRNRRADSVSSP